MYVVAIILNESIKENIKIGAGNEIPDHIQRKFINLFNLSELFEKFQDTREVLVHDFADDLNESTGYSNNYHTSFSGGEKQKLSLLRLMIKDPSIMILDEPTSAMDAKKSTAFAAYLQEIKMNKIIIIVTHDKNLVSAFDEIIKM